jgi:hypothetical protein
MQTVKSPASDTFSTKQHNAHSYADLLCSPLGSAIASILLIALVAACFGRTLGSYFLADDIGEVAYVYKIFHGQPELFWSNFTGNYMQIASMNVYRPFLLLSLVIDFVVWQAQAFGYYLSNLTLYTGCVLLLFAITKQLTTSWSAWRSQACAFATAALFAVNPLHAESVCWVVGRVDIFCGFFYLLALYCSLRAWQAKKDSGSDQTSFGSKVFTVIACAAFWSGLFIKEMAIGLPVLLSVLGFMGVNGGTTETLAARLKSAWNASRAFWISTVIYFAIRFAALGTLLGGYTGSIGTSQFANTIARWLDHDTLIRLVLPFNYYVFAGLTMWSQALLICYALLGVYILTRLLAGELSFKLLGLLAVWTATCAAPIYQLWGLGYNLEGARFYFFLTIPLSMLLPILIFQPKQNIAHIETSNNQLRTVIISSIAAVIFVSMVAIFYKSAYANAVVWLQAGKQVRAVQQQSIALTQRVPETKKILVLGLPKDQGGAHMILNGYTYGMLVSPPFCKENLADRFVTFDPVVFGSPTFINASRFKSTLAQKSSIGPFIWNGSEFVQTDLGAGFGERVIFLSQQLQNTTDSQPHTIGHATYRIHNGVYDFQSASVGDGIRFDSLDLNPLSCDVLAFDLAIENGSGARTIKAYWNQSMLDDNLDNSVQTAINLDSTKPNQFQTVYLRLSANWHWFSESKINNLTLALFPDQRIRVKNVYLLPASLTAPQLTVINGQEKQVGVYKFGKTPTWLAANASQISDAKSIDVEISKPDHFFDNLQSSQNPNLAIGNFIHLPVTNNTVLLPESALAKPGFYQVRARALDALGKPLREYSDPITIRKDKDTSATAKSSGTLLIKNSKESL